MYAADIAAGKAGPVQEMRPYEDPSFTEDIAGRASDLVESLGGGREGQQRAYDAASFVAPFTGLDLPKHAQQAVLAAKHGDYLHAAGEALGAIPIPIRPSPSFSNVGNPPVSWLQ